MTKLKLIDRPKDKSEDYLFLLNEETGNTYKAKQFMDTNAADQPVLVITVSPVDEDNKALRNAADRPDIFRHDHVLTQTELVDPDFDPEVTMATVLHQVIGNKETELASRKKAEDFSANWGAGFNLTKGRGDEPD